MFTSGTSRHFVNDKESFHYYKAFIVGHMVLYEVVYSRHNEDTLCQGRPGKKGTCKRSTRTVEEKYETNWIVNAHVQGKARQTGTVVGRPGQVQHWKKVEMGREMCTLRSEEWLPIFWAWSALLYPKGTSTSTYSEMR